MDVDAILHELTCAEGLPREALAAASARREEMVPLFLREIESFIAASSEERRKPTPLFFIFHLLGEWREKRAYRSLARLLRCSPDDLDEPLGGAKTETSHRVMAAVFDGDLQPLAEVMQDPDADEFLRSRMFEALAMVTLQGQADREEVARLLHDCFTQLQPQAECFAWNGWQSAIAMLELKDLVPVVKQVFDRGYISRTWLHFKHFQQDMDGDKGSPRARFQKGDSEYALFGDTIEELSGWYAFSEQYQRERARMPELDDEPRRRSDLWQPPAFNPYKDVGRNDPCPCGSGKKFKKCCLQA